MCQDEDDTCEIISLSDHLLKGYDKKFKCFIYVDHWMKYIRLRMKILAAFDVESDCAIRCTWVMSPNMYMLVKCMSNRYPVRDMRAC